MSVLQSEFEVLRQVGALVQEAVNFGKWDPLDCCCEGVSTFSVAEAEILRFGQFGENKLRSWCHLLAQTNWSIPEGATNLGRLPIPIILTKLLQVSYVSVLMVDHTASNNRQCDPTPTTTQQHQQRHEADSCYGIHSQQM